MSVRRLFERLETGNPRLWLLLGAGSVGLISIADSLTGHEINFSLFYLLPIVFVTWAVNKQAGFFIAFLSTFSWLIAEYTAGLRYSYPMIYLWNTLIRVGFFVTLTYLVAELHKSRKEEMLAARTDFVSGAVNRRHFNELLQMEINRIRRYPHPITMVYIDIDNFKLVNDLFGHRMGDEILRTIASALRSQLRSTDTIARLGGDEFALLLPSAQQPEAQVVLRKVRAHLRSEMKRRNLPVTFSMGVITCLTPPHSPEQIINMADELMYEVKNTTKDSVRFRSWTGDRNRGY